MSSVRTYAKKRRLPTLGLCVIARDAEATLAPCLGSVKGLVDRMVVLDTGSRDDTAGVARRLGARVVPFEWCNDFAAARNAALAASDTDWVLVLDADEELDGAAHAWIRAELRAPVAEGYVVPVRNYLQPWEEPSAGYGRLAPEQRHPRAPDARVYAESAVCRLFRRDPLVYYVGHIHEQVEYRLLELGRTIGHAGFFIHHFGWYSIDPATRDRKFSLYLDLLTRKHEERPEDVQVLLQYGDALLNWTHRIGEATECFLRAARLSPADPQVWLDLARALLKQGQQEAALIAVAQAPLRERDLGRAAMLRGDAHAALRQWDEARDAYRAALGHMPSYIVVQAKLALMEIKAGDTTEGDERMQRVIQTTEAEAERTGELTQLIRAAELNIRRAQWQPALHWLNRAREAAEASSGTRHLVEIEYKRLHAAVACGRISEAVEAAAEMARLDPSPKAVVRHATLLSQAGARADARDAIKAGLVLFPESDVLLQSLRELQPLSGPSLSSGAAVTCAAGYSAQLQ